MGSGHFQFWKRDSQLGSGLAAVCAAVALLSIAAALKGDPSAQAYVTAPSATLEGQLIAAAGSAPVLRTAKKDYPLGATRTYVLHTLEDKRLSGREIRVEGAARPDGSFQVEKFFTIHNGKAYRLRYYCETCNIVALEPGRCECCQQPTELQEIPVGGTDQDAITVP